MELYKILELQVRHSFCGATLNPKCIGNPSQKSRTPILIP
jgi:hypothetical protein